MVDEVVGAALALEEEDVTVTKVVLGADEALVVAKADMVVGKVTEAEAETDPLALRVELLAPALVSPTM